MIKIIPRLILLPVLAQASLSAHTGLHSHPHTADFSAAGVMGSIALVIAIFGLTTLFAHLARRRQKSVLRKRL